MSDDNRPTYLDDLHNLHQQPYRYGYQCDRASPIVQAINKKTMEQIFQQGQLIISDMLVKEIYVYENLGGHIKFIVLE